MGGSHAIPAQGRASDDDGDGDGERPEELAALADYRSTLAQLRGAITRGGGEEMLRALWRMAEAEDVLRRLGDRTVVVREIADQAVTAYRASLDAGVVPEPRLRLVPLT
jgi:hypothetical protein